MDTLIKRCEARGWPVTAPAEHRASTVVDVQGCAVRVELIEGLRQEPRELDEWEKKYETLRQRKRPPYNLAPTGRLTLKIARVGSYWHSAQWRDGQRRRLEDMLDAVLAGLEAARAAKLQADKEQAEAEERRREQERQRMKAEERARERERVRQAEQARVDELLAEAEAWEQSHKLRAYIAACVTNAKARHDCDIDPESELGKWVVWAQAQADLLDPMNENPTSILDKPA